MFLSEGIENFETQWARPSPLWATPLGGTWPPCQAPPLLVGRGGASAGGRVWLDSRPDSLVFIPPPPPHPVLARLPGFSRARPSWLSSCVAHLCTLRVSAGEEPRTCGKDVRRLFDQLLRKCEGGSRTHSPSYESETDSEASRRHNLCLCLLRYSLTKEENLRGPALP